MLQNISKFNLLFLLFFCLGTTYVYAQYDETGDPYDWIDDYQDWLYDQPGYGGYDYGTGDGASPLGDGSSSGGSSSYSTWSNTLHPVSESSGSRATFWENLCQSQGSSSTYEGYTTLIKNPDNCIPNMDTIIEYFASFHVVQNNGNTAFVRNVNFLISTASDEVLEKLANVCPDTGTKGILWQNISAPYHNSTTQTIRNNFITARTAIGARDSGESSYYYQVHPFDLWLEGLIRTYLLQNFNYTTVQFDNY